MRFDKRLSVPIGLFLFAILLLGVVILSTGPQNVHAQMEDWQTYTDSRYDFALEYPAEWSIVLRPGDNNAETYGSVLKFQSSLLEPETGEPATEVTIGVHTLPLKPEQSLADWVEVYEKESSAFPSDAIDVYSAGHIPLPNSNADTGQGYMIHAESPLTEYRVVHIPFGETVWFIWTNAAELEPFMGIVDSFRFGDETPRTLDEAFGPAYDPMPRSESDPSMSEEKTASVVSAGVPAYWYVPIPAGQTRYVKCGSSYHTGTAYYAA